MERDLRNYEDPIGKVVALEESVRLHQSSLESERPLQGLSIEQNEIQAAPFRHSRRRGDEERKYLSSDKQPTNLDRLEKAVRRTDLEPVPRLCGLYKAARSIYRRPTVRSRAQLTEQNKAIRSQIHLERRLNQLNRHKPRTPLRKVTFFVMGLYKGRLPAKLLVPSWAEEALWERGYTVEDVRKWVQVLRASNATEAIGIMEGRTWPSFLLQSLFYSSQSRSQGELVALFGMAQSMWNSFDQQAKVRVLTRMAQLSAQRLPQGLPPAAHLLTRISFSSPRSQSYLCNKFLNITAAALHVKPHANYTSIDQLRNLLEESMIIILEYMASHQLHVEIRTVRKIASTTLAEDSNAAISILRLAKPKKYVELLDDMKGQRGDLAVAYEISKVERQLTRIENEFLKGHLLGRIRAKEMAQKLKKVENWRVSVEETFSTWLKFLERRRKLGPAPRASWIEILHMCHDEWTFPAPFWEEAFELMEQDRVFPDTRALCLVLKGIKDEEVLDRILERATTEHFQRMNDQIWQTYLQRLAINNAPRALEIFLNAHTTDSAAGTMDTLNIIYWDTLLMGLAMHARKTNDTIWIERAFDLLAEMDRLPIFPSQHTLIAVCKLGNWAGDKVSIKGVPAWKAAINTWHDWIVRPEDFGYKFPLNGILRLVPSQPTWRAFIRLAGNYGEYGEVFDASWAMLRFGVKPNWEGLLDLDVFMQLSRDEERTLAVREMFKDWLGKYPSAGEVICHYRRWLRAETRWALHIQNQGQLDSREDAIEQIEAPKSGEEEVKTNIFHETVVERYLRREQAKPWFERD